MKLWILRPIHNDDPRAESPWRPWYDRAFGFIVRAETETEARMLPDASEETGDECNRSFGNPWLDPVLTTCVELNAGGVAGIVMVDFRSA